MNLHFHRLINRKSKQAGIDSKKTPRSIAIGKFESLHEGHLAIIQKTTQIARDTKSLSCVLCFHPSPRQFFLAQREEVFFSFRSRIQGLFEQGLDEVLVFRFNQELAKTSHQDFVSFLIKDLQAKNIVCGTDFSFGFEQQGSFQWLRAQAAQLGIAAYGVVEKRLDQTRKLGTTEIKNHLQQHDFLALEKNLEYSYKIKGKILKGRALGRQHQVPTINILLPKDFALQGVFVGYFQSLGSPKLPSIANIGFKPTLESHRNFKLCEVHILDNSGNLPDLSKLEGPCFEPLGFIREEREFPSTEKLYQQIQQDIEEAKNILSQRRLSQNSTSSWPSFLRKRESKS